MSVIKTGEGVSLNWWIDGGDIDRRLLAGYIEE